MEREISSGAMLGIVLLALAAVIGLGFGIFAIAKGVANEGTVNVQDSLGSVSSQVFLDYDQKIITGTQAVSALKTFEGKPYAVLIGTKAFNNAQKIAAVKDRPAATPAYAITDGSTVDYINYNAIIAHDSSGAKPTTTVAGGSSLGAGTNAATSITLENGSYTAANGFAVGTDGDVVFDKATAGIFKSGNAEYIPNNTKFEAKILKDKSGANIGIVLKQI